MEASTSSSRGGRSGGFEVFLSFRGPDARLTIADCLYNAMDRAAIRVFKDNEELHVGERIGGSLSQAINESKIYIPIFSKGYASSKSCLRELAQMVDCTRRSADDERKVILPIFFDVDADDVKLKTDLYQEALQNHKSDSGGDLVKQWEEALREVGKIMGKNLKDHGLVKLTDLMVKEVSSLLCPRLPDVPDHWVGIEDQRDDIMKLLQLGAVDVRYIVLHGMGGIGKTTLADVIFRQISPEFQNGCCFLKDVRTHDILDLQKDLLSDILHLRCTDLSNATVDHMIKSRFRGKKVLIVLDDIDNRDQIKKLAGEPNWFGGGSRIIVTTRNIQFLEAEYEDHSIPVSHHGNFTFHEMREMNRDDALRLFCERALGRSEPPPDYVGISGDLIDALGGLPLALDVIGSTLRGQTRSEWEHVLQKLKKVMNEDVKKKLIISYEALDSCQQEIYLDIACFFINQKKITAIKYWDAVFGYSTEIEIKILVRMSLIKVIGGDKLWMHDQLRDLGRHIVRPESREIHYRGSRLWSPKDAFRVVQSKMGNENIVALNLGIPESDVTYIFKRKEFARMVNLRFLQLDRGNFEGDFKDLFTQLRWLSWSNCSVGSRATNFGLENLVVLMLSGDNITEDWGGWCQIMVSKQLKVLQLQDCPSLTKTPDFSVISRLERLILRCTQLREIDESIGNLQHLDYLEIECEEIESIPESIGGIKSLTELRIECVRLSALPYSIGNLVKLKHLILSCLELRELPDSIGQLESLIELDVGCPSLTKTPKFSRISRLERLILRRTQLREIDESIGNLQHLDYLKIKCEEIESIPESIGSLKSLTELRIECGRLSALPYSIGNLVKLKHLILTCLELREFPDSIGQLESLIELDVACPSLTKTPKFSTISRLESLIVTCTQLREIDESIGNLQHLDYLEIKCEAIESIPKSIGSLKSLTELRIDSQRLSVLPYSIGNLVKMKGLILRCQELRELPYSIGQLESLLELDVCDTRIKELPNSIGNLERLRIFRLLGRTLEKLPETRLGGSNHWWSWI